MKSRTAAYVAAGCLIAILLAIGGALALWRTATRTVARVIDTNIHDPVARERSAKKLLRADALPAGYYPMSGTFELPFLVHVRLSDRKPDAKGRVTGYDHRGFIYTEAPWTDSSEKVEQFFRGEGDVRFEHVGTTMTREELLGRGTVDNVEYTVIRASLSGTGLTYEGPAALILVQCSTKKERAALWFAPEAGDANAIRAMMAHFALCKPKP